MTNDLPTTSRDGPPNGPGAGPRATAAAPPNRGGANGRRSAADLRDWPLDVTPELLAEIAAINARLEAGGFARRIEAPTPDAPARDRVSTQLFHALRDTRDRRILELVYRINGPLLLAFCRSRLRRHDCGLDPHDLLEDTFLQIWMKCDRFQERENATFTGWALVVADHLILQNVRARRRESARFRIVAEHQRSRSELDPSGHAVEAETRARMEADWSLLVALCACGLERLPEKWRRVLFLRDIDGLSYREIGERLVLTKGNVGMMIRRGRRRLIEGLRRSLIDCIGGGS